MADGTASGEILALVTDSNGDPLPGVAVTVDDGQTRASEVTNVRGEAQFLQLKAGDYKVTAMMTGFETAGEHAHLATGATVRLGFILQVAEP